MEYITLANGVKMPQLGYGVYQVTKEECERCVLDALDVGYRAIDTAQSYSANPYDDKDRIQKEAYENLRPKVKVPLPASEMTKYDVIFVGSPIWWHQPAMVVCTFLEGYDLSGKTIVPFFTYGARSYLNESMQRIYKSTPNSVHVPAILPKDIEPDNIQQPQNDDDGIIMPADVDNIDTWIKVLQLK